MDIDELRIFINSYWTHILIVLISVIFIVLSLPVDAETFVPNNEDILLIPKKIR